MISASMVFAFFMIASLFNFILQVASGVAPTTGDMITVVVGLVITILLKVLPQIPSKINAYIGMVVTLFGLIGPGISSLFPFPPTSHVPYIIAFFGAVLLAISERIQGGVTDPAKRRLAEQGQM